LYDFMLMVSWSLYLKEWSNNHTWPGIVLGVVAGFIGSRLVNKTEKEFSSIIVLGIVGAVVGGLPVQHLRRGRRDAPESLQPSGRSEWRVALLVASRPISTCFPVFSWRYEITWDR